MPSVHFSVNTSGDNEIVAAVAGKSIRVLAGNISGAGTVTGKFESEAGTGNYLAAFTFVAGSNSAIPYVPVGDGGCFETAAGKALNLELGGAVLVHGWLKYALVGAGS